MTLARRNSRSIVALMVCVFGVAIAQLGFASSANAGTYFGPGTMYPNAQVNTTSGYAFRPVNAVQRPGASAWKLKFFYNSYPAAVGNIYTTGGGYFSDPRYAPSIAACQNVSSNTLIGVSCYWFS